MVEAQTAAGLVFLYDLLDLGHRQPFAGRTALMRAEVPIGVPGAIDEIDADLATAVADDLAVAVVEFRHPAY